MARHLPSLEEIAFNGQNVPVKSTQPGDLIMVAEESVLVSEFEAIATKPMELGDGNKGVFFIVTFKGVLNNDGRLKAVTTIGTPDMTINLVKRLRHLYTQVPAEYR